MLRVWVLFAQFFHSGITTGPPTLGVS